MIGPTIKPTPPKETRWLCTSNWSTECAMSVSSVLHSVCVCLNSPVKSKYGHFQRDLLNIYFINKVSDRSNYKQYNKEYSKWASIITVQISESWQMHSASDSYLELMSLMHLSCGTCWWQLALNILQVCFRLLVWNYRPQAVGTQLRDYSVLTQKTTVWIFTDLVADW